MLKLTAFPASNKSKAKRMAKASEVKDVEATAVVEARAKASNKATEPNKASDAGNEAALSLLMGCSIVLTRTPTVRFRSTKLLIA